MAEQETARRDNAPLTKRERLILRARRLMAYPTPLESDCGEICGKRCCQGGDDKGMYVFPGEERFLKRSGDLRIVEGDPPVAVCGGSCRRISRPLACMFFPYLPVLRPDGLVDIVPDVRAFAVCPLLREKQELSPLFVHRMMTAAGLLARDETLRDFLNMLNEENEEALALLEALTEEKT